MAAAYSSFPIHQRQRIATVINGIHHWISLSDPDASDEGNRTVNLTPSSKDAAFVQFVAATGIDDPQYILFTSVSSKEPRLLCPRHCTTDLGTVSLPTSTPPVTWIQKAVPVTESTMDQSFYTIHLATDTTKAIAIASDNIPRLYPVEDIEPLKFWTENLCEECRLRPTDDIVCYECCTSGYNTIHHPCHNCGEDTDEEFCSRRCMREYCYN